MLLRDMLRGVGFSIVSGSSETDVGDICYDSRKAKRGDVFVCLKGERDDGGRYVPRAIERGASAIVFEGKVPLQPAPEGITTVKVENAREALAVMSAEYFGNPAGRLRLIGITGTKGKTTTSYILRSILSESGERSGLMGTVEVIAGEKTVRSVNTTPESYDIHRYLKMMADSGCRYAVMEVSSQGIKMDRVAFMRFDYALFTNLSPDHIGPGEHSSFREYMECKKKLFSRCDVGLFNADDAYCEKMAEGAVCRKIFYSLRGNGDINGEDIRLFSENGSLGAEFKTSGMLDIRAKVRMPGAFSVCNSLAAAGVGVLEGIDPRHIAAGIEKASVRGRGEMVYVPRCMGAVIDYAHNEASVRSLLRALRQYGPDRVIVVFGCGGSRPAMRREAMGEAVGELADLSIVTCDNPRYEELRDINRDIIRGLKKKGADYREIDDRREAIEYAVSHAGEKDMIAVLGKGHEEHIDVRGRKRRFSDKEAVKEAAKMKFK